MTRYDERLNPVFDHLAEAERLTGVAIHAHGNGAHSEILKRIDSALSFTEVLLRQADPSLVSANRIGQLQATIDEVRAAVEGFNPETAPDLEPADQAADRLLDAAAGLPHRTVEKAAEAGKALAQSFQRSTRQRERSVNAALQSVREKAEELEKKVEVAGAELSTTVDERASVLEARAAEVGTQLENAQQAQAQLLEEQRSAFQEMQNEMRSSEDQQRNEQTEALSSQREEADALFRQALDEQNAAASEIMVDLHRKDEDAEQLVGSISIRGTADRYEKEAETQAHIANKWRIATVVIGLVAGVIAGSAAFLSDQEPAHIAGKLALGLLFAGVAGYTARQSAQHRRREEQARKLHLDLAAFGPFIEPLPEDAKNAERVLLGRRVFAREMDGQDLTEHGTSIKGLLSRSVGTASSDGADN